MHGFERTDDASSSSRVGRETHPAVEEMRAKERAIVVRSFVRSFDRASICRYDDRPNGDENDGERGGDRGARARGLSYNMDIDGVRRVSRMETRTSPYSHTLYV